MPARTHQQGGGEAAVRMSGAWSPRRGDPQTVATLEGLDRSAELVTRLGALQQVMIELAPPDAVAHGTVVSDDDLVVASDHAGAKAGDRLQGPALRVRFQIQSKALDDLRRNPAGADLVARKRRAVDNQHVEAGATELPGAG